MSTSRDFNWKRHGKSGKGICPVCKQRTLVRYRHKITGEVATDEFGVCDRVYHCGFKKAPPEDKIVREIEYIPPPPDPISYTDYETVKESIKNPKNNLFKHCCTLFGELRTRQVFREYLTGDSIKREGGCTFWFMDAEKKIRGGLIVDYDERGHRIKSKTATWEHEKGYNFVLCNFGDHLIAKHPPRPIHVVEAPKTAIMASLKYPGALWIATNGLTTLQEGRCEGLKGRDVVLYPDREPDEFPENAKWLEGYWKKKGDILKGITKSLKVFDGLLFEDEGTDIADLI